MNAYPQLGEPAVQHALGMLSSLDRVLANPAAKPQQLKDIQAHLKALVPLLQQVGRATVLANVAIAYRILAERRLGQYLNTLEEDRGRRAGGSTELQRAVCELGIAPRTAARWRAIGAADQKLVDAYLAPAFAAFEGWYTGEGLLDERGDHEALLSTAQLLRLLGTVPGSGSAGAASAASRAARDDDGAGLLTLELPDDLLAVIERVLGSIDRHVREGGMRDPDWRGRVLITPPKTSAVPYSMHLLRLYESGSVTDAILVAESAQSAMWWGPFAGRPHCLLSSAALEGLPAGPLTVFALSADVELRARFAAEFRRLGYVYPAGAVSDIAAAA